MTLVSACNENIAQGDKLTQAERDYLRSIAAAKCISESNENYEDLENASNSNMLAQVRDNTLKYEYKKDGTLIETSYLYVWKVSPPDVYYRLSLVEAGITSNKFIKIDTSENTAMFRSIQSKGCNKTLTVTGSTFSKNANLESARTRVDVNTLTESETDYRAVSTYPAYFANLNKLLTRRTLNNDEVVTKTEKYDYVISSNDVTVQPLTYNDATIANRSYCVVKRTAPTAPSTYDTYAFPYELECTTEDVIGPDANGDAVSDFAPSAELAGPF
jgi:hypothetical protein